MSPNDKTKSWLELGIDQMQSSLETKNEIKFKQALKYTIKQVEGGELTELSKESLQSARAALDVVLSSPIFEHELNKKVARKIGEIRSQIDRAMDKIPESKKATPEPEDEDIRRLNEAIEKYPPAEILAEVLMGNDKALEKRGYLITSQALLDIAQKFFKSKTFELSKFCGTRNEALVFLNNIFPQIADEISEESMTLADLYELLKEYKVHVPSEPPKKIKRATGQGVPTKILGLTEKPAVQRVVTPPVVPPEEKVAPTKILVPAEKPAEHPEVRPSVVPPKKKEEIRPEISSIDQIPDSFFEELNQIADEEQKAILASSYDALDPELTEKELPGIEMVKGKLKQLILDFFKKHSKNLSAETVTKLIEKTNQALEPINQ